MRKNKFTDVGKWELSWYRNLSYQAKFIYIYMIERADMGGFIELDSGFISTMTSMPENEVQEALKELKDQYVKSKKWAWIKEYVSLQRNLPLNPENNAHKSILSCIKDRQAEFNTDDILTYLGADPSLLKEPLQGLEGLKGLGRGLRGTSNSKGNSNGEGNTYGKGKGKSNGNGEVIEDVMNNRPSYIRKFSSKADEEKDKEEFIAESVRSAQENRDSDW